MRLFTGIALPQQARTRLSLMQGGVHGARWTAEENYHITLSFIGEVDEETAETADEALAMVHAEAFSLELAGAGNFAQGEHPQVLWIGVKENAALNNLQAKAQRALEAARVPLEARRYTPHVTMARLRHANEDRVAEFLRAHADFSLPPFKVETFFLYESVPTKNGSVYAPLRSYALI